MKRRLAALYVRCVHCALVAFNLIAALTPASAPARAPQLSDAAAPLAWAAMLSWSSLCPQRRYPVLAFAALAMLLTNWSVSLELLATGASWRALLNAMVGLGAVAAVLLAVALACRSARARARVVPTAGRLMIGGPSPRSCVLRPEPERSCA